ncbi:MAG TPA: NfeD family protein [Anaerohalosphaeraceae bacterium]|nr:NfeD family protein [Anaerohalosphaeraceae bacterium]
MITDILWLVLAVFLFAACAILLVLEIFVPSFGLLTVSSLVCLGAGIAIFFEYGTLTGWIGVAAAAVLIPLIWIITYRLFPKTSLGRKMILGKPDVGKGDAVPDCRDLQEMLSKIGVVRTPLRPVGICDFDGRRFECVSERGFIEVDQKVQVIRVQGTALTVRPVEEIK